MSEQPARARPGVGRAMVIAAALVVAFGVGIVAREVVTGAGPDADVPGLFWPDPKAVGPFELVDHGGTPFDLARLEGKWTLMFFGYTHCPDVCPVTLSVIKQAYGVLEREGVDVADLQTVFVSVDPERDTLDHLREYLGYFDPRFVGVTGDDEALQGLTRQLGVLYIRNEPDENGSYLVDHTASVLVLDPEHRLVGLLGAPHEALDIADRLTRIRAVVEG